MRNASGAHLVGSEANAEVVHLCAFGNKLLSHPTVETVDQIASHRIVGTLLGWNLNQINQQVNKRQRRLETSGRC